MVTRMMRLSYGDYQLEKIPVGMAVEIPVIPVEKHKHKGPLFAKMKRPPHDKSSTKTITSNSTDKKPTESSSGVRWVRNLKS